MADRDKPRGIAIGRGNFRGTLAPGGPPRLEGIQHKQSRTEKELEPLASRVAENAALMQQFRASIGSENRELVREVNQAITRYAQELDPTITFHEVTNIIVALLKRVGHFKAPRPAKELEPLAMRIAENAALMQRLRIIIGGPKDSRLRDVMAAVRNAAQELDPTMLYEEETTIIELLTQMVGPKGPAGGIQ
jgi:hypothetical protein